ncbi:hypothetical protein E2C01_043786 [Portunus trituberculatus]|uniref:Uncharacterized protein n=1 Tax=Portunus trituberculatus TaxID=210409 RepID=A0A5B7FQD6_PORTR|nr:hypothetical protein [Portunus trituberculatus]
MTQLKSSNDDKNLSIEVAKNDGLKSGSTPVRSDISDLANHVIYLLCLPAPAKQQHTNMSHEGENSDLYRQHFLVDDTIAPV